jgi:hypothetical protein
MAMPASILIMKIIEVVFLDNPSALKNGIFQRMTIKTSVYNSVNRYSIIAIKIQR